MLIVLRLDLIGCHFTSVKLPFAIGIRCTPLWNYGELFWNYWNYLEIFGITWKYLELLGNIWNYITPPFFYWHKKNSFLQIILFLFINKTLFNFKLYFK